MSIFGGSSLLSGATYYEVESEAHQAIQAELAEAWLFKPMHRPSKNAQQEPDPARKSQVITAIFEWEAKEINLRMEHLQVSSRKPRLTIHNCVLYHLRRGDVFERCIDGSQFEVRTIERDGMSGIQVELVQLGVQD